MLTLAGIAIIGEEETTSGWLAPRAEETAPLARSAASTLILPLLYTVYILYYVQYYSLTALAVLYCLECMICLAYCYCQPT